MNENLEVSTLDEWLDACEAREIRAVALRKTSEIRPAAGEGHAVTVAAVQYVRLVGYRAGRLVKVRLEGMPADLRRSLDARGFTVREVWDNLG